MMRRDVYNFLSDTLKIPVDQGFVMESTKLPAASFISISNATEKDLSDGVALRRSTWQVEIISNKSLIDCDSYVKKLAILDGKPFGIFQKIIIVSRNDMPLEPDVKLYGVSIDVELVPYSSALL